jgi:hypothetical protein
MAVSCLLQIVVKLLHVSMWMFQTLAMLFDAVWWSQVKHGVCRP